MVSEILAYLDYLDEAIGRVSGHIDKVIAPFAAARELLTTIPASTAAWPRPSWLRSVSTWAGFSPPAI